MLEFPFDFKPFTALLIDRDCSLYGLKKRKQGAELKRLLSLTSCLPIARQDHP
jgi:hypothetical protein